MSDSKIDRRTVLRGALATAALTAAGPAKGTPRMRMPTLYIPHGGGPCFFMKEGMGPPGTWDKMAQFLRELPGQLPAPPKAILVISAHWEKPVSTVLSAAKPPLLYDYSGFPDYTYQLKWPAPGAPKLAERVQALLGAAGIESATDAKRGFDHGVFIPLKLTYPDARIPTTQLSLVKGLNPQQHIEIGRALAPLRDEGVLLLGSGMSYHNLRRFGRDNRAASGAFDDWLNGAVTAPQADRELALCDWEKSPRCQALSPPRGAPVAVDGGGGGGGYGSGAPDLPRDSLGRGHRGPSLRIARRATSAPSRSSAASLAAGRR